MGSLPPRAPRTPRPPPRSPAAASATSQGHSRCESGGARDAEGREGRAARWAPGSRPPPGRLARSLARSLACLAPSSDRPLRPRRWAALSAEREEAGCACPAWGGAMLLYGQAGRSPTVTKGLGNLAVGAEVHPGFVWKG